MDGFEGLAAAIMLAMACMVTTPAALFGAMGYFALRRRKLGFAGALGGVLFGVAIGGVAVGFTFFEDTMRPPAHLEVQAPPGFAHEWVILIADPSASTSVEWEGWWTPSARVSVPSSGVLRVRELGRLDGESPRVTLNGRDHRGSAGLALPASMGGGRMVAFTFADWPGTEPDVGSMREEALAARIRELEAEGR